MYNKINMITYPFQFFDQLKTCITSSKFENQDKQ